VIVEPLSDAKEWEDFVANSSKGSFFHTLKWKKVLEESFPFESLYLVIRDSNDKLIGVCPFFITKMRLSDRELCEYLKTKTSRVDTNSGTMILDLKEKPVDFIWNEVFKQKQRKYIKRFEHDGFKTKEVESEDDLKKFYVLYLKSMNQKDSLPYPFTFYKNEFDLLYPNNFNIIFIENEERCIGAGIVFIYEP
jgi:predicted N-acyltransferase